MFESLKVLLDNNCKITGFDMSQPVERRDYYLTPLGSNPDDFDLVKLAARYTLSNGEVYGNIIQIPFSELQRLVEEQKSARL